MSTLAAARDRAELNDAEASRAAATKRMRSPSARHREVVWVFPGTDCRLILDVDFDEFGVPRVNDVLDATRERFPFDDVWFQGKPLADVLFEYLCNTPAEELQCA